MSSPTATIAAPIASAPQPQYINKKACNGASVTFVALIAIGLIVLIATWFPLLANSSTLCDVMRGLGGSFMIGGVIGIIMRLRNEKPQKTISSPQISVQSSIDSHVHSSSSLDASNAPPSTPTDVPSPQIVTPSSPIHPMTPPQYSKDSKPKGPPSMAADTSPPNLISRADTSSLTSPEADTSPHSEHPGRGVDSSPSPHVSYQNRVESPWLGSPFVDIVHIQNPSQSHSPTLPPPALPLVDVH